MSTFEGDSGWRLGPFAEAVDPMEGQGIINLPPGMTKNAAGVIRDSTGRVVYAPPGSYDAAMAGIQEDASGHFTGVNYTLSDKSGVRI